MINYTAISHKIKYGSLFDLVTKLNDRRPGHTAYY